MSTFGRTTTCWLVASALALVACDDDGARTPAPPVSESAETAATPGNGAGVFIATEALAKTRRASLLTQIAEARRTTPEAFELVARLRSDVPQLDAQKRGQYAALTRHLVGLGTDGLMPMLERMAVRAEGRGTLTDTAWTAWQLALLEATGRLRDARAEAVLRAIVDTPPAEPVVARAAAAAYAKLNTPEVASVLIGIADQPGAQRIQLLGGMGYCRRTPMARHLASLLDREPDKDEAIQLALALGDAGSAWAWETPIIQKTGEQADVRAIAAEALVRAYARYQDTEVRKRLRHAILKVDDPSTMARIDEAIADADEATVRALEGLRLAVKRNPIR